MSFKLPRRMASESSWLPMGPRDEVRIPPNFTRPPRRPPEPSDYTRNTISQAMPRCSLDPLVTHAGSLPSTIATGLATDLHSSLRTIGAALGRAGCLIVLDGLGASSVFRTYDERQSGHASSAVLCKSASASAEHTRQSAGAAWAVCVCACMKCARTCRSEVRGRWQRSGEGAANPLQRCRQKMPRMS